jgi:hypothetical protein
MAELSAALVALQYVVAHQGAPVNVPLVPLDHKLIQTPHISVRDAVRRIMDAHPRLAKPLSAPQINARLPPHLRRLDGTIRHHMRAIWREAKQSACL